MTTQTIITSSAGSHLHTDDRAVPYLGNLPSAERNAALKALANAAGLRLPTTIVPEGESLLPIGEENKRKLASTIDALPDLAPALAGLRARIRAEDARDVEVPIQRVRMSPVNGGLYGQGQDASKALAYTKKGFGHVVGFVKPDSVRTGAGDVLLALPPPLRAQVFDHFATSSPREQQVVLRTNVDLNGRRLVRAVVSDRHSLESGDDAALAAAIESAVPAGAKVRITRDSDHTVFELLWPAMNREIRVGDAVLFGLELRNSETKSGAIKVWPKILRALCFNFTTAWSSGGDEEITMRHIGDLKLKLGPAVRRALALIDPFVRAFGDAYKVRLPDFAPTRGEVLARMSKVFALPESTMTLAAQMWDADGARTAGDTLAGAVNALTRASQEQSMRMAGETEAVAGKLIMQGWDALN